MAVEVEEYDIPQLVIHGSVAQAQYQQWSDPVGFAYTSHNGRPAFCMHLKVTDFYRNIDGSVGCTIDTASLRSLIAPGSSQTWTFEYDFTVYASLLVGDVADYPTQAHPEGDYEVMLRTLTPVSKVDLFTKPYGTTTYYSRWGDDVFKLASPVKLNAQNPVNKKLYLIISILSICTCAQAGVDTPVYVDDISEYIPTKKPYFWRMQKGKDPNHPTSEAQDWHLVRPFYICREVNGVRKWCNCEEYE